LTLIILSTGLISKPADAAGFGLKADYPACRTMNAYEAFMAAVAQKDNDSAAALLAAGLCRLTPDLPTVTVVEVHGFLARSATVLIGGGSWIVPREALRNKP